MSHLNLVSNPIHSFLTRAELAPRQVHKALTLWPLVWPEDAEASGPASVPLREALERGEVQIDEVDEGGSVPHVRVTNRGKQPVLFLFGEEIVGAKQNRVANATFLVPAKSKAVIDVSCVEAGRWGRRSRAGFHSSQAVVSSALRRKMARKVQSALVAGRGFTADQGEVWDEIGTRLVRSRTDSRTSAWADYRESRAPDLAEIERAFHPVERQVGFVAILGNEVVGLEALGRSAAFASSFHSLLRAYTIDAVDAALVRELEARPKRAAQFDAPEPFIAALAGAPVSWSGSLGLGSDLRVDAGGVSACALACEGLVHVTAFPAEAVA
jgi:hypothetical protein